MEIKYFKNLDGIRAIAVLMVMLSHFLTPLHSKFNILQQLLNKSSMLGQLGVSLFFVLSGFLITRILLNTKEKKQYFKNFYVRRILRIFPLYYLFLILFYYIFPFILDTEIPKFSQQLYYFTYLQNFAITFKWDSVGPIHFWSLAVEEHFYIFWPFIIYFFKDNKVIRIIILLIVSSIFLRFIFIYNSIEVYYFTFTRIDSLAIGALLAILEKNNIKQKIQAKYYLYLFIIILVPTSVLLMFYGGNVNKLLQVFKYTLFSLDFALLIAYVTEAKENILINRVLKNKLFIYTGKISYGLYVYHLLSYTLVYTFFKSEFWLINFIFCFSVSYLLSALSFHFMESKFLLMKKYFSTK